MEHQQRRPEEVGRAARVVRHGEQLPPQRCPRCDSNNTKFCYFNNYSSSQPRYFCKTCRRYWTHGGTLRNVPQGGGGRKGKRSKRSSASATTITTTVDNHPPTQHPLDVEPSVTAPAMPSVFYGGGGGMIGDFGGSIPAAPAATIPPPFDHRFFHGLNFQLGGGYPPQPQQLLGFNLDMTSQSRAPFEIPPQGLQYQPHQLNTSLFTTTTTTTTITTTGAGDGTEGYWRDLASGEGSSFWVANRTGFVPRPPSPPPFI